MFDNFKRELIESTKFLNSEIILNSILVENKNIAYEFIIKYKENKQIYIADNHLNAFLISSIIKKHIETCNKMQSTNSYFIQSLKLEERLDKFRI